jgi:NADH:ubiquinone oxidoreductase subunit 2 (subunit N)
VTLLLIVAIGAVGAGVSAWGLGRGPRVARTGALVGVLCLVAVTTLALAMDAPRIRPGPIPQGAGVLDGHFVPSAYLRLVIGLWGLDAVVLAGVGWFLGGLAGLRALLPATLAAIVGATVGLAATDLTIGAAAAGAVGLAALLVLLADGRGVAGAARELRVSLGGTAVLVILTAAAPVVAAAVLGARRLGEDTALPAGGGEAGAVAGLLALTVGFVVAVRLGAIPFHLRVPRLADVVPPISLPLLLAWIAVPLVVVALAISDELIAPLALPLDGERWLIVATALVTLVASAFAAFIQDDVRHVTGYLVIADAGLVLLGFAALDPGAWGPTRVWLLAFAASKTAVAAWAAVAEDRFGTRSLPDLRGWLRHSPILGAAFVVAVVATYGLPGWAALTARVDLARLSAGSPLDGLLVLAGLATLPTYARLLALGTGPATSRVRGAAPERVTRARASTRTVVATSVAEAEPALATEGDAVASAPAGAEVALAAAGPGSPLSRIRPPRAPAGLGVLGAAGGRVGRRVRQDRTELLAAAVLALAVLAALTSWGALDVVGAAREAAPIVSGPSSD